MNQKETHPAKLFGNGAFIIEIQLWLSFQQLKNSKEVLLVFGSLFTSDPGDIHKTIESLVKDNIKVSVIGLSAQVAICQELVNRTNNEPRNSSSKHYGVIMNETHFKELLMDCVTPLPLPESEETKVETKGVPLIKWDFLQSTT